MAKKGLFVLLVGCGRLGSYLANRLSLEGHSVVAIDINPSAFDALSGEFSGFRVEGDAAELAVLKQAKIDQADLVIAATGSDSLNLMVAQVARRIYGISRVVACVFDPGREAVYRDFDIKTLCPTSIAGDLFLQSLGGPSFPTEKGPI